jgi:hypothetical protein
MSDERKTPELSELEAALGALSPRRAAIDRDALMYRAGQAAGARPWRWATAVSTFAALFLGGALLMRPTVERLVPVPVPAPAPSPPAPPEIEASPTGGGAGPASYLYLQEQVLNRGLDGLPPFPPGADLSGPDPALELRRGL